MKKGWKIFWVMCISLGVLGIALCISGRLLGATAQSVREAYGIPPVPIVEYGAHDGSSSGTPYTHDYSNAEYADSYDEDENGAWTQYFSQIEEFDIDVTCLEVNFYEGEESDITVDTSEVDREFLNDLMISSEGNELKIELKNRSKWDKLGNTGYESKGALLVWLPSGHEFDEVSVKVGAGVLYADDIHAKELDIEVGAGRVNLDSFTAKELDLECGAGEAILYGEVEKKANIECGVGQVNYTAVGYQEDYDYEVSCGIGSVTVGSDSYSGLGGERKVNNGGSKKMEIECGIGMVDVSFDG